MSDVFISFAHQNNGIARQLFDRLVMAGKDVWADWEWVPLTSPNWWMELRARIAEADNFVFILSPDSMASVVCNMELDYAFELNKRVIPVVYAAVENRDAFASVADFTPDTAMQGRLGSRDPLLIARENWQRLSHIRWINVDHFESAMKSLRKTVETDSEYVKAHTRYLVRALAWEQVPQQADMLLSGEELDYAEAWLRQANDYEQHIKAYPYTQDFIPNPLPKSLHRNYIQMSRVADRRRHRRRQNLSWVIAILVSVILLALIIEGGAFIAEQGEQSRANRAATQTAEVELSNSATATPAP